MDNLQPVTNINADELPAGFSLSDPTGNSGDAASSRQQQSHQQQALEAQQQQRQDILQQALTPDALARLRRLQLVSNKNTKSNSKAVENAIINLAMSGQLSERISEGKLIEMLERGQAKRDQQNGPATIRIERKKYNFDSDDDDNDDDLM